MIKTNRLRDLSIKFKFTLGMILILVVAMFTLSFVFIRQSERLLIQNLTGKANLLNRNFSIVSAKGIEESTFSNLQILIREVAAKDREIKAMAVAYLNGMVIASSDSEKFRRFSKIDDEDILRRLQERRSEIYRDKKGRVLRSFHIIFSQDYEEEDDYEEGTANQDIEEKEPLGFIYTELDTAYLEKSVSELRTYSMLITLILMGAGIWAAYWFGKTMTAPIQALAEDVRIIASGNLKKSIRSRSRDEIGRLVCDVETMRLSIKDLTDNLEEKVEKRTEQLREATVRLARANEEITGLNEQLKEENLRMGAELEVTRKLQKMVLPAQEELRSFEYLDIACYMEPADEVGGDYYDVLRYEGSTKIGIGDVTGHGLESGVVMLMTQTAVRTLLTSGETDPIRFLSILNRTIYDNMQRMNIDKMLTLSLLDYIPDGESPAGGRIRLSGQHEDMLLVKRGGNLERVDTADLGFYVGLEEDISTFIEEKEVSLSQGDGVVLYSDGITEAENMDKEMYGIERLCDVISRNWDKSAEDIKLAVIWDVREYIGEQVVYDDITLVVVKQR